MRRVYWYFFKGGYRPGSSPPRDVCMAAGASSSSIPAAEGIVSVDVLEENGNVLTEEQRDMVTTLLELDQVPCFTGCRTPPVSVK